MYPGGGALGPSLLLLLLLLLEENVDGIDDDDLSRPTILSAGMEPALLSMVAMMSALVKGWFAEYALAARGEVAPLVVLAA